MEQLILPLSDQEEAILSLMKQIEHLKDENRSLHEEIKMLKWTLQEHD